MDFLISSSSKFLGGSTVSFSFFSSSSGWNANIPKEKNTPQLPDTKEETASENEIFLSKEVKEGVDDSSIC